jgi:hypothetical protein
MSLGVQMLAAIFNLNHPAHTVDWHFVHLSVANVIVIGLMLIVFALAILLPFPGAKRRAAARRAERARGGAGQQ